MPSPRPTRCCRRAVERESNRILMRMVRQRDQRGSSAYLDRTEIALSDGHVERRVVIDAALIRVRAK